MVVKPFLAMDAGNTLIRMVNEGELDGLMEYVNIRKREVRRKMKEGEEYVDLSRKEGRMAPWPSVIEC